MQIRCGVDIIEIDRVGRAYSRHPEAFLRRLFSAKERTGLGVRKFGDRHLAARFAAKEAVFKLLGVGMGEVDWVDVEVLSNPGGEPRVRLKGRAKERADFLGIKSIALSLSHCKQYAVAQAVALAKKLH